jgi:TatA/E family protein of Tat protein translocase
VPFNIGPFELLLVLVLALLILGPGKLPEVGSALGRTIREFRRTSTEVEDSLRVEPAAGNAAAANTVTPPAPAPVDETAGTTEDRPNS